MDNRKMEKTRHKKTSEKAEVIITQKHILWLNCNYKIPTQIQIRTLVDWQGHLVTMWEESMWSHPCQQFIAKTKTTMKIKPFFIYFHIDVYGIWIHLIRWQDQDIILCFWINTSLCSVCHPPFLSNHVFTFVPHLLMLTH